MRRSPLVPLIALTLAACATAALAGCASVSETLDWKVGDHVLVAREKNGWKGIRGDQTELLIYARPGETPENWTEKVEVIQLPIAITLSGRPSWNPESVMTWEKAKVEKQGCATEKWTVLERDTTSILYEWQDIRCPGWLHQRAIVRIVMGRWYLWFISYGIKDKTLSATDRAQLIESLQSAKVVRQ